MSDTSPETSQVRGEPHRYREILGLLSMTFGALLFLSLLTYNPMDPCWNVATTGVTKNAAGPLGAYLSDLFFQLFGIGAYVIVFLALLFAFVMILQRRIALRWISVLGYLCIGLFATGLLHLWFGVWQPHGYSTGGVWGQWLGTSIAQKAGNIGAQLLLLMSLILSIVWTTRFSFMAAAEVWWHRLSPRMRQSTMRWQETLLDWRDRLSRWSRKRQERKQKQRLNRMAADSQLAFVSGPQHELPALDFDVSWLDHDPHLSPEEETANLRLPEMTPPEQEAVLYDSSAPSWEMEKERHLDQHHKRQRRRHLESFEEESSAELTPAYLNRAAGHPSMPPLQVEHSAIAPLSEYAIPACDTLPETMLEDVLQRSPGLSVLPHPQDLPARIQAAQLNLDTKQEEAAYVTQLSMEIENISMPEELTPHTLDQPPSLHPHNPESFSALAQAYISSERIQQAESLQNIPSQSSESWDSLPPQSGCYTDHHPEIIEQWSAANEDIQPQASAPPQAFIQPQATTPQQDDSSTSQWEAFRPEEYITEHTPEIRVGNQSISRAAADFHSLPPMSDTAVEPIPLQSHQTPSTYDTNPRLQVPYHENPQDVWREHETYIQSIPQDWVTPEPLSATPEQPTPSTHGTDEYSSYSDQKQPSSRRIQINPEPHQAPPTIPAEQHYPAQNTPQSEYNTPQHSPAVHHTQPESDAPQFTQPAAYERTPEPGTEPELEAHHAQALDHVYAQALQNTAPLQQAPPTDPIPTKISKTQIVPELFDDQIKRFKEERGLLPAESPYRRPAEPKQEAPFEQEANEFLESIEELLSHESLDAYSQNDEEIHDSYVDEDDVDVDFNSIEESAEFNSVEQSVEFSSVEQSAEFSSVEQSAEFSSVEQSVESAPIKPKKYRSIKPLEEKEKEAEVSVESEEEVSCERSSSLDIADDKRESSALRELLVRAEAQQKEEGPAPKNEDHSVAISALEELGEVQGQKNLGVDVQQKAPDSPAPQAAQEQNSEESYIPVKAQKFFPGASNAAGPIIQERKKGQAPVEKPKNPPPHWKVHGYDPPSLDFLNYEEPPDSDESIDQLLENSKILEKTLENFGVKGQVSEILPGPVITLYEYSPEPGIKVSKIAALADDLAMALCALMVRVIAPIPGKGVVGIEVPNKSRETVYLKEILADDIFQDTEMDLPLAMGKDITGNTYITNLTKMPHLLIAGTTGSGKSVGVNGMICSLLYHASPDELRLMMIDPKMLELSIYDGIPHLLLPVITEPKKASTALAWAVNEMERRYKLMAQAGVRNIKNYNALIKRRTKARELQRQREQALDACALEQEFSSLSAHDFQNLLEDDGTSTYYEKLPFIVIIIDELADLMMVAAKEVEFSIARLAQMARAAGIHLMLATQRPSVDVLTGVIKANFPSRLAFQVKSKIDSRTILDQPGAERLLGMGDMLLVPPTSASPVRIHGNYVSEEEIHKIVRHLKKQGAPQYNEEILKDEEGPGEDEDDSIDEMYDKAVEIVLKSRNASISSLQRKLRVGYNRAARMVEMMEREGVVGPQIGSKPREIFVPAEEE